MFEEGSASSGHVVVNWFDGLKMGRWEMGRVQRVQERVKPLQTHTFDYRKTESSRRS